jgi:hypothetical protein
MTTWIATCEICKQKRPMHKIDVRVLALGQQYGFDSPDAIKRNICYCSDNLKCANAARELAKKYYTEGIFDVLVHL